MKDESEFHKCSKNKDGLRTTCKECRKIETKEYRSKYREKVLRKKREWYKDTKNKKKKEIIMLLKEKFVLNVEKKKT